MISSEKFNYNIKLIEIIRKYPCLWDTESQEYHCQDYMRRAWHDLAEEFGDSGINLRLRWKSFKDGMRRGWQHPRRDSEGNLKNSYYLAEYLDFMDTYKSEIAKSLPRKCIVPDDTDNSSLNDVTMLDDQEVTEMNIAPTQPKGTLNEELHKSNTDEDMYECWILSDDDEIPTTTMFAPPQPVEPSNAELYNSNCNANEHMDRCWHVVDDQTVTGTSIEAVQDIKTLNEEFDISKSGVNENLDKCGMVMDDQEFTETTINIVSLEAIEALQAELRNSECNENEDMDEYETGMNDRKLTESTNSIETVQAVEALKAELHNSECNENEYMDECGTVTNNQEFTESTNNIETVQAVETLKAELRNSESHAVEDMDDCVIVSDDDEVPTTTKLAPTQAMELPTKQLDRRKNSSSENVNLSMTPSLKRMKNHSSSYNSCNAVQVQQEKAKNFESSDIDGDDLFLNSLLPYLQNMTGKQNRRFQQKVIALIDEVLDDSDIAPQFRSLLGPSTSYPSEITPANTVHYSVNGDRTFTDLTGEDKLGKACKFYSLV